MPSPLMLVRFRHQSKSFWSMHMCLLAHERVMGDRIARNVKHFDTWCTYQGCETASWSDIPADLKQDIRAVFDVTGKLPFAWVDKVSIVARCSPNLPCICKLEFFHKRLLEENVLTGLPQVPPKGLQRTKRRVFRGSFRVRLTTPLR